MHMQGAVGHIVRSAAACLQTLVCMALLPVEATCQRVHELSKVVQVLIGKIVLICEN